MDKRGIKKMYELVGNLNEEEKTIVYLFIARHLRRNDIDIVEAMLPTKSKRYKLSASVDFVGGYM